MRLDSSEKLKRLCGYLKTMDSILVAFSGGMDSSFLLKVAFDVLSRDKVLAVTAVSETYTGTELKQARKFARVLGVRHEIIRTNELKNKKFSKNPKDRCFYCKKELFGKLKKMSRERGLRNVVDASNADDLADYRPGSRAKKMFGVESPLQDAGISKKEIRRLSRKLGIESWDFPSMACLASRIPCGTPITVSVLRRIENAESYIRKQGVKQVRVRYYVETARIEVEKKDIKRFLNRKFCDKIIKHLKSLGFCYIVLDLEGYRTGSLNPVKGLRLEK